MLKYIQQYRFYLILLAFILIPILSLDTTNRAPQDFRIYDKVVLAISAPVQISMDWLLDTSTRTIQNVTYLWKLRGQNENLIDENRKLLNTIVNLRELEQENVRLRNLLNFKESFNLETVMARVIARDVTPEFRSIRINRGSLDGIEKNMAVIHSEGVVGRVYRVEDHISDVITVLDPLSAVDAYILRSRARGIVEGLTDALCQLKFALRTDDIQPGDILLSSGLGGTFPKGVPVGTIIRVIRKAYGITQTVEVRPSTDFSKLEEVLVVTKASASPMHTQEIGGNL